MSPPPLPINIISPRPPLQDRTPQDRIDRLTREARGLEEKGMIIQASQVRMSAKITAWLFGLPEEL